MERYCSRLGRAVASRKHPYASLSRRVLEQASLDGVVNTFSLQNDLPRYTKMHFSSPSQTLSLPHYHDIALIGPHHRLNLDRKPDLRSLRNRIALHLSTQWGVSAEIVKQHVPSVVQQYSRVHIVDGDTISSTEGSKHQQDNKRDATFLQYELLVDRYAHRPRAKPEFVPTTFFGQLHRALAVQIQPSPDLPDVDSAHGSTFILLDVEPCDTAQDRYGFYEYNQTRALCIIDGTAARALVGRIRDGGKWVIVKREGGHEHASYQDIHDDQDDRDDDDEA